MADLDVALETSEINVTLVLERTVGGEGGGGVTSWNDLEDKPSTFPPSTHNHDDLYFTEAEVTTALAGKSDTGHNHDSRYYTETEIDAILALRKFARIPPTAGDYYSMDGQSSAATAGLKSAGEIVAHPIFLQAGTIDRIAVSTSVAAASTWRLGIYTSDPTTGLPDGQAPLLDAGTVNMNNTAGVQAITVNLTITTPGIYWVAVLVDAYTAQPTTHNVTYSSNSGLGMIGLPQDMSSLGRYRVGRRYGGAVPIPTGSLPTFPTASMSWVGVIPRIAVRYA